jgi:hypothetical protein
MRSVRSFPGACAALAVTAGLLSACGADEPQPPAADRPPKLASAQAIDGNPGAIACGHVRDQQKWADVTRRATVALADRAQIQGLSRLRATQSVFFAMTELCKGRPASYQPATAALRAVERGDYRADLAAP